MSVQRSGSQPKGPRASLRDLRVIKDQAEGKSIGYKSQRGGGVWQGWTNEQTEFLSIPQGFAPNGAAI